MNVSLKEESASLIARWKTFTVEFSRLKPRKESILTQLRPPLPLQTLKSLNKYCLEYTKQEVEFRTRTEGEQDFLSLCLGDQELATVEGMNTKAYQAMLIPLAVDYISRVIDERKYGIESETDFTVILEYHIISEIFRFLPNADFARCHRVSNRWKFLLTYLPCGSERRAHPRYTMKLMRSCYPGMDLEEMGVFNNIGFLDLDAVFNNIDLDLDALGNELEAINDDPDAPGNFDDESIDEF